jgi:hypothetical protein
VPPLRNAPTDKGTYYAKAVYNAVPPQLRSMFVLYVVLDSVPLVAAVCVLVSAFDPRDGLHWFLLPTLLVFLIVIGIAERVAGATNDAAEQLDRRPARLALSVCAWVAALASGVGLAAASTGATALSLSWGWPTGRFVVSVTLIVLSLWLISSYSSSATGPRRDLLSGRGAARLYSNYSAGAADKMAVSHALRAIVEMATLNAAAFAVVTHSLLHHLDAQLTDADGSVVDPEPVELMWFYGWRLLNALPGAPMETLSFEEPYRYTAHWVGVLVLLYFFAVVGPAVSFVRELVAWRRNVRKDESGVRSLPASTRRERVANPQEPGTGASNRL